MAEDKYYAARWAGGYVGDDNGETPFVALQVVEPSTGKVHELIFTEPARLMGFINEALATAEKMFPERLKVDRSRSGGSTH